jgi:hypothetical protein
MDIEGAEGEVLRSSINVLRKFKPKVIIEPHIIDGELTSKQCRQILEGIGYTVREIEQYGSDLPLVEAFFV